MGSSSGEYNKELEVLRQLTVSSKADTINLPPLIRESQWYDSFMKQLRDWLNWLLSFIKMPEGHYTLQDIVRFLVGLVIVLLVATVVYLVISYFSKKKVGKALPAAPLTRTVGDSLNDQIAQAMGKRDFALAARLRWKLFLLRTRQGADRTPGEILDFGQVSQTSQFLFYRLMFFRLGEPNDAYLDLDRTLARLESSLEFQK